jgi:hypothetical protein
MAALTSSSLSLLDDRPIPLTLGANHAANFDTDGLRVGQFGNGLAEQCLRLQKKPRKTAQHRTPRT